MAGKSSKKGKFIKEFIHCLHDDEPWVIHAAVQALGGVTDDVLLPYYKELLDKYKNNEYYIQNNVQYRLNEFEKQAATRTSWTRIKGKMIQLFVRRK